MIAYLDTSVVLRVVFRQRPIWVGWGSWDEAWSSELMGVEARRTVDRLRLEQALDDEGVARSHESLAYIERAVGCIRLTRPVLRRTALPMATAVKTLDAIHLSSAMLYAERQGTEPVFVTHDERQGTAARALGFEIAGVE